LRIAVTNFRRYAPREDGAERRIGTAGWATCAIALGCLSSCNAIESSSPAATWALLSETDENFVLVNTEVVDGEFPAIWAATVQKPTSGLSEGDVAVSQRRYKFDCENRVGRIDYAASYDRFGKLLGEGPVREDDHPFVPNSIGDLLMKLACGVSDLPRPTHASPLAWLASPDNRVAAKTQTAANFDAEAAADTIEFPSDTALNGNYTRDEILKLDLYTYLEVMTGKSLEEHSPSYTPPPPVEKTKP